ncbi:helix-hairpin-helix domain-containing protein [Planomonospora corallina]|uniref:Helix-hairpin-helix domain-containing protein n=1 Tax=Planomonospora corallina TaxID=1806052 RepID=A0ABV8I8N1_9ACTN
MRADEVTERFRAESRLRTLTAPGPSSAQAGPGARDELSPEAAAVSAGSSGHTGPTSPMDPAKHNGPSGPSAPSGLTGCTAPAGPAGFTGTGLTEVGRTGRTAPAQVPSSFAALRAAVAAHGPALDPGRPGVRALILVALAAVIAGGVYAWRSQPEPELLAPPAPVSGPPATETAPPRPHSSAGTGVTVHVTGKVRRPGVFTLPGGSRVTDAVSAAGGVRKGASSDPLNLARRLVDGEQIVIGGPRGGPAATAVLPAPAGPADPTATLIDLNAATAEQLEELPGVGEVLARRITEYRDGHGGFRSVEQLREVSGIGEKKYAEMKDRVRV